MKAVLTAVGRGGRDLQMRTNCSIAMEKLKAKASQDAWQVDGFLFCFLYSKSKHEMLRFPFVNSTKGPEPN